MESTRDSKSYLREVKGSVKTLRSGGKKEEEDRRRWSNFSQRLTMGIWAERRAQLESGGNEMTEKPIHSDKERMEQKVAMGRREYWRRDHELGKDREKDLSGLTLENKLVEQRAFEKVESEKDLLSFEGNRSDNSLRL